MDGRIWISWIAVFCTGYSRLLQVYHQKHEIMTDNPPIKIYVNQLGNRIAFRIKAGYHLERLIPETMRLIRSNESKII